MDVFAALETAALAGEQKLDAHASARRGERQRALRQRSARSEAALVAASRPKMSASSIDE